MSSISLERAMKYFLIYMFITYNLYNLQLAKKNDNSVEIIGTFRDICRYSMTEESIVEVFVEVSNID